MLGESKTFKDQTEERRRDYVQGVKMNPEPSTKLIATHSDFNENYEEGNFFELNDYLKLKVPHLKFRSEREKFSTATTT